MLYEFNQMNDLSKIFFIKLFELKRGEIKMKKLIIIFMCLFLYGCSVNVTYENIKKSESLCEKNKGVLMIRKTTGLKADVYCNNGAVFYKIDN